MNLPPVIPTPAGQPSTIYPNYSPSNGLGTISSNYEGGIGVNEYGLIFFKNLQTGTPEQIIIDASGITKNDEPTLPWGSISTALEKIISVVAPAPDANTLEVNNKIIITDGASNQLTFSAINNSITATTDLTVAPITTFNQNVKSILPPQAPEDLINLAYLQTFPPSSQLDLFLNYSMFPTPPIDGYSLLSGVDISPATNTQTTITLALSPVFITGFANQISNLQVGSYIPAGIWDMNLFCNVTTSTPVGHLNIFWRLYGRTALGVETQISGDSSLFNLVAVAPSVIQTAMTLGVAETDITAYESLVVKIYGTISAGSRIVNTYYEGSNQYSHLHTSFGIYVPPSILSTTNTWTAFNTFDAGVESNGTTSITGALYDSISLAGSAGQILSSTGTAIAWTDTALNSNHLNLTNNTAVGEAYFLNMSYAINPNSEISASNNLTYDTYGNNLSTQNCTVSNTLAANNITTNGISVVNSQSWSSDGIIVATNTVNCPNVLTTNLSLNGALFDAVGSAGQEGYILSSFENSKVAWIPANSILDTQNIWSQQNVFNSGLDSNGYTSIAAELYDGTGQIGTAGQVLSSTGSKIAWTDTALNSNHLNLTTAVGDTNYLTMSSAIGTNTGISAVNNLTYDTTTSTLDIMNCTISNLDATVITTNGILVKNSQSWSSGGVIVANTNVICPNFTGLASKSTNIAGGAGGSIPYQTAVNTTALLANGTAGYLLTANGTTLAPSWNAPIIPTLSQVLASGNSAGSQSITALTSVSTASLVMSGAIVFTPTGGINCIPTSSGSGTVVYPMFAGTSPASGTLNKDRPQTQIGITYSATGTTGTLTCANFAGNATTSTNIAGGAGGSIPYQTAVNTTALLANGTAGYVLTANGGTLAPTWNAVASGNATNITGGVAGAIPYQSAASTTLFTAAGTSGQLLQSNGTSAPTWITNSVIPSTIASYVVNYYQQYTAIGYGQTCLINNAASLTQYITASNVTFPTNGVAPNNLGGFQVGTSGTYSLNMRVQVQTQYVVMQRITFGLYAQATAAMVAGTDQLYIYNTSSTGLAPVDATMMTSSIVNLVAGTTYCMGFIMQYSGTLLSGYVGINQAYINLNRLK